MLRITTLVPFIKLHCYILCTLLHSFLAIDARMPALLSKHEESIKALG